LYSIIWINCISNLTWFKMFWGWKWEKLNSLPSVKKTIGKLSSLMSAKNNTFGKELFAECIYFAECFLYDTRQRPYLPSIFSEKNTLGKGLALGKDRVSHSEMTLNWSRTSISTAEPNYIPTQILKVKKIFTYQVLASSDFFRTCTVKTLFEEPRGTSCDNLIWFISQIWTGLKKSSLLVNWRVAYIYMFHDHP